MSEIKLPEVKKCQSQRGKNTIGKNVIGKNVRGIDWVCFKREFSDIFTYDIFSSGIFTAHRCKTFQFGLVYNFVVW